MRSRRPPKSRRQSKSPVAEKREPASLRGRRTFDGRLWDHVRGTGGVRLPDVYEEGRSQLDLTVGQPLPGEYPEEFVERYPDALREARVLGFVTQGARRENGNPVRSSDVTLFLRQLILLLEAGTPLLRSLQTLSERGHRPAARARAGDPARSRRAVRAASTGHVPA